MRWIWVLAFVAILSPHPACAQVQAINGSVRGRVLDQTGANNNQLAALVTLSSGDQQNIVANQNLNGDTIASVSRPLYLARNAARGPNVYQFDLRYTRTLFTLWDRVKPKFLAEANNVFNHPNITALNATATVNSAGVITKPATLAPLSTTLEGRIIQLGLRVDW
jgi:hypothetical protein